jgi:hypothetical protein
MDLQNFGGFRAVWLAIVRLVKRLDESIHGAHHAQPQPHLMDAGMGHIEFRPKG